ncbi:MAG TPA: NAD(P)-binding domain-containing protein, partial [Solirubrobacteraceae bacterium]|nr:NAD(P)-binding domain-containing protein [Solirubrobacteraceae bacterium]
MPAKSPDPVAVIGASGALGFGLSLRLAATGVPIAIGSRDPNRARETAARAGELVPGGTFSAHDNAGAASAAATVVLSVPFRNQSETLANIAESLQPGQLFIDATVPLAAAVAGKATRMLGV